MNLDDVEVIERKTVCQSYFRIDRYMLRHRLFGGGWSEPVMREVFERGHSCACLLYDPKADAVILIEQFRAGAFAAGMGPWLIECVAGIIDEGETPEEVARREAVEECGCTVGRIEPIGKFLYSTGACSEVCHLFVGEADSAKAGGIFGVADEHEDIKTHIVPVETVLEWLDAQTIDNAAMLIAISWLARHHAALRQRWLTPA
jgi:ADP-ribose pyrophosphatase